jgi:hypothetical protein
MTPKRKAPKTLGEPTCPSTQFHALVKHALLCLDPRCSDEQWRAIGAAAYRATNGSEEGLEIFKRWSRTGGETHEKRPCLRRQWRDYALEPLRLMVEERLVAWDPFVAMIEGMYSDLPRD